MHNQNDDFAKYALLTQAILGDPRLSSTDKIVLGRISGFTRFYESAIATAEFCGLSERQVKDAKRKLEKLGYIIAVANTGRGKAYRTAPDYLWIDGRPTENRISDIQKNGHQTYGKSDTENKERIKKELKGASAPAKAGCKDSEKEQEEFGNHEINEFMKRWIAATDNDCTKIKRERRAVQNLIKSQSKEGIDAILAAVQQIHESGDRYAPAITNPSELVGQYSKLPKLRLYVARNESAKTKAQKVIAKKYGSTMPDCSISDAEREKVKEAIKAMKESGNLPWVRQQEVESENK